ncbi:lysylphosphatidylglycerol synthase transmembrane domain-containing protein [Mycobacterium sp. ITM-2016-00318]|uniref:lysylphosphatidylglycerol synthase transmembrane domain-containing protein n=1 Tax=Mycobacterium sp. ITM-2016-00318 TaxID=2099693 RepID=UPI000CF9F949|nr:lysylphosphatidylglycerol synthase transmembrane domain-containing protein [Mycobacterium sp. ITM-2016-00318]WNG93575.1 lysylphosphatidylglycerol synthase transmembrane domain-containing protein [Mycobacterium sp. ITM-2016-00318]
MRVDGRDITVTGSLLQPLARRTSDILRLLLATVFLGVVITSSLITRYDWVSLEKSISDIVGVLTPTQSNLVYLAYGIAILALPFAILIGLIAGRHWKLLGAYAAAGVIAVLALSVRPDGISAPQWHFDVAEQPKTFLSQFLDDPRWIAMLAAMLTVSGPWLPARWRHWWWALLLAFIPIHLAVSAVVPARSLLGLAVGWFVGALVILVVGTPALEVPLEGAVRAMDRRGCRVSDLTVVRLAGRGSLLLSATCEDGTVKELELYSPNQRSGGALRQLWRKFTLRGGETAPFHASMRRVVEHRALMAIAIGDLGVANTAPLAVTPLDRGWTLYAHTPACGTPVDEAGETTLVPRIWGALRILHDQHISHGDLRARKISVDGDTVMFGGFEHAEYGATDAQLQSDIAQLLVTTTALYDAPTAVRAAMGVFGKGAVLTASQRLAKAAVPKRIRESIPDARGVLSTARDEVMLQTGADEIEIATVTRFNRNQILQMVLLVALVYVALPFISTVPTFLSELRTANYWWALLGLLISVSKYVGAAAALWACADGLVSFRNLTLMQVANTFAATTTPAGVGGLALSARFLQKGGLGALRAATAVALQQSVQVVTHITLLILFSAFAGASADLAKFVPSAQIVYAVGAAILVVLAAFVVVPRLRRFLTGTVGPRVREVLDDLRELASEPRRLILIVLGCAATTLGGALALWACIEAFGGNVSIVTVTVVTMIGGTLASAAPTPGGVGAVEAALIGGLAAFGVPAGIAVPSVLLYRVLTCWLPVFVGWFLMRWLTDKDMI